MCAGEQMKKADTFQELILRLHQFWSAQGCLIVQPSEVEVGAGTLNKHTFFRVLGPEPWNVAYVAPSRRPADGRYGENPNRLQYFYQYQVVLKPIPTNVQELYVESLRYLGLDPQKYDLRFVEDNWEHPVLGAWGLGWEVWACGMEITQYTYFQQCGGVDLEIPSCELTYGLERLAMYLQDVNNFFDLKWGMSSNQVITYGELAKRDEYEWSHHNFHEVNTQMLFNHFDDFYAQAQDLLQKKLIIPAYDYVLKCSHTFNVLDARGAISVTQRAGYIQKMRLLACQSAADYYAYRKDLGFPLVQK